MPEARLPGAILLDIWVNKIGNPILESSGGKVYKPSK
jgi:hypothetical protein